MADANVDSTQQAQDAQTLDNLTSLQQTDTGTTAPTGGTADATVTTTNPPAPDAPSLYNDAVGATNNQQDLTAKGTESLLDTASVNGDGGAGASANIDTSTTETTFLADANTTDPRGQPTVTQDATSPNDSGLSSPQSTIGVTPSAAATPVAVETSATTAEVVPTTTDATITNTTPEPVLNADGTSPADPTVDSLSLDPLQQVPTSKPTLTIVATDAVVVEDTANNTLVFMVTQSNASTFDTNVIISLDDISTINADDITSVTYGAADGLSVMSTSVAALKAGLALTIPSTESTPWSPVFTFTVKPDAIYELNEFLTLNLALAPGDSNATIITDSATGAIYDQDSVNASTDVDAPGGVLPTDAMGDRPQMSIANVSVEEGSDAVFAVTVGQADVPYAVTFGTSFAGQSAVAGDVGSSLIVKAGATVIAANPDGSYTVPAGTTALTVTVATIDNATYEGAETFLLTGKTEFMATNTSGIGTITDDGTGVDGSDTGSDVDDDRPQMSIANVSVEEGSDAVFAVTVGQADVPYAVTFGTSFAGQSAVAGDVGSSLIVKAGATVIAANPDGSYTVPAGTTALTVTVATIDNATYEGAETFLLTGKTEFMATNTSGIGTITDDGTGVDGSDTGSDVDDDRPQMSIANVSVEEGSDAVFAVTVGQADVPYAVTFGTSFAGQSAVAGDVGSSLIVKAGATVIAANPDGSYTVPAGTTALTVTVATIDNATYEGAETFLLTGKTEFMATNTSGIGTITDDGTGVDGSDTGSDVDDDRPQMSIANVSVEEGSDAVFAVTVGQADVPYAVTFGTSFAGQSAVAGDVGSSLIVKAGATVIAANPDGSYTVPAGTTALTVTVATIDNATYEGAETFLLTGKTEFMATNTSGIGTITDDGTGVDGSDTGSDVDDDRPQMSIANVSVEEGSDAVFAVTVGQADVPYAVTFGTSFAGQSAVAGDVGSSLIVKAGATVIAANPDGSYTVPAGTTALTVTVATIDNATYEGAETFLLTGKTEFMATNTSGIGTITDDGTGVDGSDTGSDVDDDRPQMSIANVSVEEGSDAVFAVTVGQADVPYAVTFGTSFAGQSAVAGDVGSSLIVKAGATVIAANPDGSYTVPAGTTALTVTVATIDNATYEGAETFLLTGKTEFMATNTSGIGTITDDGTGVDGSDTGSDVDDDRPQMSIANVSVEEGSDAVFAVTVGQADVPYAVTFGTSFAGQSAVAGDVGSSLIVKAGATVIAANPDGSYTVPAGTTALTVTVATIDNATYEGAETFLLTGKTEFMATNTSGIGTITDDGTGVDGSDTGSDVDDDRVTAAPDIALIKTATVRDSIGLTPVNDSNNLIDSIDDYITYQIQVVNEGGVELTGIKVYDPMFNLAMDASNASGIQVSVDGVLTTVQNDLSGYYVLVPNLNPGEAAFIIYDYDVTNLDFGQTDSVLNYQVPGSNQGTSIELSYGSFSAYIDDGSSPYSTNKTADAQIYINVDNVAGGKAIGVDAGVMDGDKNAKSEHLKAEFGNQSVVQSAQIKFTNAQLVDVAFKAVMTNGGEYTGLFKINQVTGKTVWTQYSVSNDGTLSSNVDSGFTFASSDSAKDAGKNTIYTIKYDTSVSNISSFDFWVVGSSSDVGNSASIKVVDAGFNRYGVTNTATATSAEDTGSGNQVDHISSVIVRVDGFNTPVIFDMNNDGEIAYLPASALIFHDFNSDGIAESTAWVAPEDGLLALQKEDGIHNIVFSTQAGETDLQGLAKVYDSNKDGVLDGSDADFAKFGVWQDADSDGIVDNGEFLSLADRGITSLSLTSDGQVHFEANGDVIVYGQTTYTTSDGQLHIAEDVGFAVSDVYEPLDIATIIANADAIESVTRIDQLAETDSSSSLFVELGGQTYEIAALAGQEAGTEDILSQFVGGDTSANLLTNKSWTDVIDISSDHGGPGSIIAAGGTLNEGNYANGEGDWTVIINSGDAKVDASNNQITFASESADNSVTIITADGASHDINNVDKIQWHG